MINSPVYLATVSLFLLTVFVPTSSAASASAGASIFKAKCAMCHGQDGSGNTPMGTRLKIRDLRSPEVQKQSDDELIGIVNTGKPPMPAYGKILQPSDIQNVVAFLRNLQPKA